MSYEFNEVPASKKKSSKLRNLFIAIILFVSIFAVKEVASHNLSQQKIVPLKKFSKPAAVLDGNFSYAESKAVSQAAPAAKNLDIVDEIPAQESSFVVKNFTIQEKAENISSSSNSTPILDVGIIGLIPGAENLTAILKNYAALTIDDELCLNVSGKTKYAFACSNISLYPLEEKHFLFAFPFSEGGVYNSQLYLNRADDNSQNDNFSLKIKHGEIHDLAIDNITLEPDKSNPLKIDIKVHVLNNGDFNETALSLSSIVNNQTRDYGPYNYSIINSHTFHYTRTFNESGDVSAAFSIVNYSNFAEDADEENNIKTTSIHLES